MARKEKGGAALNPWERFRAADQALLAKVRRKTPNGEIIIFNSLKMVRGWGLYFAISSLVILAFAFGGYLGMDRHYWLENPTLNDVENPFFLNCPAVVEREEPALCDSPTLPPLFSMGERAPWVLDNVAFLVVANAFLSFLLFGRIIKEEEEE
jgi:hypothetical protein